MINLRNRIKKIKDAIDVNDSWDQALIFDIVDKEGNLIMDIHEKGSLVKGMSAVFNYVLSESLKGTFTDE